MNLVLENNISETGAFAMLLDNRQYLLKLFTGRTSKIIKEETDDAIESSMTAIQEGKDSCKLAVDKSLLTSYKRKRVAKPAGAPRGA